MKSQSKCLELCWEGLAASWKGRRHRSGKLKLQITEALGGRLRGEEEQGRDETLSWGFQVGDRDTWSLFYPVSQEIRPTACHAGACKLIPKWKYIHQVQDNLWDG